MEEDRDLELLRKLEAICREFCDRVERGEVRSVKTYGKMCEALGRENLLWKP